MPLQKSITVVYNKMDLRTEFVNEDIEPFYVGGISATVSSDGEILATPMNEDVVITDLSTNKIIHKIEGDGELVTNLVLTPDGKKLAILSQSQQLRIFDLKEGQFTKTFKMSSPVYISAVDKTSSLFAFGGSDGVITVWDIEGGYVTHSLKGHGVTICSLIFHGELNSSNWKLASGDIMGTVKIWDLVKRKCISTINEHNSAVRGVAFDNSGEHFISGGRDQIAIIYNTKNYKPIKTFLVKDQIESTGFIRIPWARNDDDMFFYTAGSDNILKIWNSSSGKLVAQTTAPRKTNEELMIIDVLELNNESFMLVISDQTLVFIDMHTYKDESDVIEIPIVNRIAGNHGTIADIRYVGPDFQLLALATNSPSLRLINPNKPFELNICEGHTDLLNAIDVSIDGLWIATASKDNDARLWKWNGDCFEEYAVFQGHAGAVTAISLPKATNYEFPPFIITGSSDLTVKKWKVPKPTGITHVVKTSEYTRRAHEKDINALDISPNDEYFATASYDKLGKVWDLESGETIGVLKGHKRGLWDINFCKFDKLIATSSGDKTAKLWSLNDFTCTKTFEGHTNAVQRVKFFNKNQQIITSGADGLIKIWDIKDIGGECLKTIDNHNNRIWAFDVKNDGLEMISADADGQLSIWSDNTDAFLKEQEHLQKAKVEQEQKLTNYISNKDWSSAFLLALTLDHPMRLYNVIKSSINLNEDSKSAIGSFKLEDTIGKLSPDQILKLFKKIRDWNVNGKFFEISQKLLTVILHKFEVEALIDIPGLMKIIDSIIPYSERHFTRIDDLIEQSYILDYTVKEMDKLI